LADRVIDNREDPSALVRGLPAILNL
jgi:hypothetical protein